MRFWRANKLLGYMMNENYEKDCSEYYKNNTLPLINRYYKRIILTFSACIGLLYASSKMIEFLEVDQRLIFVLFFPCAIFYLIQIFSIHKIGCPNCGKSLFSLFEIKRFPVLQSNIPLRKCPHCNCVLVNKGQQA